MLKRLFDISFALIALLLVFPILTFLWLVVRFRLGKPVLFRQKRPGLKGESFEIIKFRTMANSRDMHGRLLTDEQRLTKFGRLLRATSLDELPEFFNVLKGDMSIVGPRPLLMEYLSRYTSAQARRHEVRPGITGWAQVNGRNALSWEDKFRLDVWYVDNQSFSLDVKILVLTVWKIINRENICEEGHVTMSKFMGSGRNV